MAADFNGDGLIDLAAPDGRTIGNGLGFSVALAKPGGGYATPVFRSVGFVVLALCSADFNNDGLADLVLVSPSGVAVVLADGAGGFGAIKIVSLPLTPMFGGNAATGDFNGDGIQDILVPGDAGYAVALGTGTGTFQIAKLIPQLFGSPYVVTGDFNNDGKLDFAGTSNSLNPGAVYLGNGNGTFQPPIATVNITFGAVAADFNNDGILDLAMMNVSASKEGSVWRITIAPGVGNGQFYEYSNYIPGVAMTGLVAADFNGDGKIDLATQTWDGSTHALRVLAGTGASYLSGVLTDLPVATDGGSLLGADLDGNGSKDLLTVLGDRFMVFRSTHGNPPLLAQVSLNPPSVIGGGASSTGTVLLGGVSPAGAVVTLASSDSALAFFPAGPTVTIPAGASSATFQISTVPVAAASSTNITATWSGVTQSARLDLVPTYTLTGLSINPASQYGIFSATGTVTLSGPADSAATVALVSANPASAAVPASVTVPAGATSANFTIALQPVVANTAVGISAVLGSVTQASSVTVLRPADAVAISKALFTAKMAQLKVEATSTSNATTVTVYNAATGVLLGTLSNAGGGKYNGTMTAFGNLLFVGVNPRITLKSALGGTVSGPVEVK